MLNIQKLIASVTSIITTAMQDTELQDFHNLAKLLAIVSHFIYDIQLSPNVADFIVEVEKIISKFDNMNLRMRLRNKLFQLIAEMEDHFGKSNRRVNIVFSGDRSTFREIENISNENGRNFYCVDELEENNTVRLDLLCVRDMLYLVSRLKHYSYTFEVVKI